MSGKADDAGPESGPTTPGREDARAPGEPAAREAEDWFRDHEGLITTGELSAGIVHEARNLLTGVLGMVQVVRRKAMTEETRSEWLGRIEAETRRCVDTLNTFLRVPRLADDALVPTDLNEVVDRSVALARHTLEMRRVRLSVERAPSLPTLQARPELLQKALLNLMLNAMQAMPNGGNVHVTSTADADGGVTIAVWDDGPGVPEELRERVFQPLFTTRPAGEGTGLGLPFCRQVASMHGGTLVLTQTDAGARFELRLPAASDPKEQEPA